MTIGYGTRDVFFDNCWEASVLIFLESIVSILLDCISLGIVYSHISSGRRRATSILFSDRAVIQRVHGELYFGFQVVEQKKHPLVEAHVRCYAVRDETDAWGRHVEFQPCAMRLEKPDGKRCADCAAQFCALLLQQSAFQWPQLGPQVARSRCIRLCCLRAASLSAPLSLSPPSTCSLHPSCWMMWPWKSLLHGRLRLP